MSTADLPRPLRRGTILVVSDDQIPSGYTLVKTKALIRARWFLFAVSVLLAISHFIIVVWANPLVRETVFSMGFEEMLPWDIGYFLNIPTKAHAVVSACIIVTVTVKEFYIKRAETSIVISSVLCVVFIAGVLWYLAYIIFLMQPRPVWSW